MNVILKTYTLTLYVSLELWDDSVSCFPGCSLYLIIFVVSDHHTVLVRGGAGPSPGLSTESESQKSSHYID